MRRLLCVHNGVAGHVDDVVTGGVFQERRHGRRGPSQKVGVRRIERMDLLRFALCVRKVPHALGERERPVEGRIADHQGRRSGRDGNGAVALQ